VRNVPCRALAVAAAIAASAAAARAQWATFQDQTATRLVASSALGAADPQEKDYAWADFDQDGDGHLACGPRATDCDDGDPDEKIPDAKAGVGCAKREASSRMPPALLGLTRLSD